RAYGSSEHRAGGGQGREHTRRNRGLPSLRWSPRGRDESLDSMSQATWSDTAAGSFIVQAVAVSSRDFFRRLDHLAGVAHAIGVVPCPFALRHGHSIRSTGTNTETQTGLSAARVDGRYGRSHSRLLSSSHN